MRLKPFFFGIILYLVKMKSLRDREKNKPLNVQQLRNDVESLNKVMGLLQSARKDVTISEEPLAGIPCYLATPPKISSKVILYLHGGGYVLSMKIQSNTFEYFMTELAVVTESLVYAIEYRLAPEHPHPAAIDDAMNAYLALLEKGIAANDISVVGDSAGGGLALALLMKLRDEGKPLPASAVLISPWTDLLGTGESYVGRAKADKFVDRYFLDHMAAMMATPDTMKEPYLSPFYGDFTRLPPLMITVGGCEILFDDATRVADKAKLAGGEVSFETSDKMLHVYPVMGGIFEEGRAAIDHMAQFIKKQR